MIVRCDGGDGRQGKHQRCIIKVAEFPSVHGDDYIVVVDAVVEGILMVVVMRC